MRHYEVKLSPYMETFAFAFEVNHAIKKSLLPHGYIPTWSHNCGYQKKKKKKKKKDKCLVIFIVKWLQGKEFGN